MTRQVFTRAVGMFRGTKQSFDFGFHNSARYDVCANARAGEHNTTCSLPGCMCGAAHADQDFHYAALQVGLQRCLKGSPLKSWTSPGITLPHTPSCLPRHSLPRRHKG